MLQITNLNAGYDDNKVLDEINLDVNRGEMVALFGHNGSGKSTVLRSIFNLTNVYSGKILFKGRNLIGLNTFELIGLGVSYAPQGHQVFRKMTVKENLELNMHTPKDINHLYDLFPFLKEKDCVLAETLSGGQQQLLGICRALVQTPELMLLDEPSLGLDHKSMKTIFKKIKEINDSGITILIAEQRITRVIDVVNRYYFLSNGKIIFEGKEKLPSDIWKRI